MLSQPHNGSNQILGTYTVAETGKNIAQSHKDSSSASNVPGIFGPRHDGIDEDAAAPCETSSHGAHEGYHGFTCDLTFGQEWVLITAAYGKVMVQEHTIRLIEADSDEYIEESAE